MDEPTTQEPTPKRRWFQFSLRTLLILVTLAVVLLAVWRVFVEPYRQQRETVELIKELDGAYKTEAAPGWVRWMFGDDSVNLVFVDVADCNDPDAYLGQVAALPDVKTLVVGGEEFVDEHVAHLKSLDTLRGLILDSTSVTDGGIEALKKALPKVVVYKSDRRLIAASSPMIQALGGEIGFMLDYEHWDRRPELKKYVRYANRIRFRDGKADDDALKHVTGLTKLESLDLNESKVTDAGLAHLKSLTNLKNLDVRGCGGVSDAGLEHLKSLTNLESLELSSARITDAGLARLKGLSQLRWLMLDNTKITDAGLAHLGGLTNLYDLHLKFTRVTGAGLDHLRGLTKLERLSLQRTQVTDTSLAYVKGITNLKDLDLIDTQVTDAGLAAHLKSLTHLEDLNFMGTRVTDAGLAHLKGLTNLRSLDLRECTRVGDAGLAHLKGLTNLRGLYLDYTQVSDAGLVHLKGLPKLDMIFLYGTKVTGTGVLDLKAALGIRCYIGH